MEINDIRIMRSFFELSTDNFQGASTYVWLTLLHGLSATHDLLPTLLRDNYPVIISKNVDILSGRTGRPWSLSLCLSFVVLDLSRTFLSRNSWLVIFSLSAV
jgi:hypothetical protein